MCVGETLPSSGHGASFIKKSGPHKKAKKKFYYQTLHIRQDCQRLKNNRFFFRTEAPQVKTQTKKKSAGVLSLTHININKI